MIDTFKLTIVAPESLVLSEAVSMVVIPGSKGDFGVLMHHAPMISSLRPGLLQAYNGDKVSHRLFISGGFANINERGCTVLAEECSFVTDLKLESLEEQYKNSLEDLAMAREEEERANYLYTHQLLHAKIEILRRLSK